MRIAVVGLGYVGLVTASCLARLGQIVVGLERDPEKLDSLAAGRVPYYEPHLAADLASGRASGALTFTGRPEVALAGADVVMICVGTPSDPTGRADLTDVLAVTEMLAAAVDDEPTVALRSTVPVGTTRRIETRLNEMRAGHGLRPISVIANPEFLRTGRAIDDFLRPTRIVIGTTESTSPGALERLTNLYAPLEAPTAVMDANSAELVKNASNAFLATRLSFVNELAALCESTGADIDAVLAGMADDPRIGGLFMRPGIGFGGSCLPKDVRSLIAMARDRGLPMALATAVDAVNVERASALIDRLAQTIDRPLAGARVGILGLAFKPDTDDVRESPALALASALRDREVGVVAYDPQAGANASRVLPWLEQADGPQGVATAADAIVLATEWPEFVTMDLGSLAGLMRGRLLVDGRNALDPDAVVRAGLRYIGVGRPPRQPSLGGDHPGIEV